MEYLRLLYKTFQIIITAAFLLLPFSCEEFVKTDPPRNTLIKSTVFDSDATANAAVINIYYNMKSSGFASGGSSSISFWGSYSSDEQVNFLIGDFAQFNENDLLPDNSFVLALWSEMYKTIYETNAILEGLEDSRAVTPSLKQQLRGEALFLRAFCYFYLGNLFGDVPLVLSTDYRVNATVSRSPSNEVYRQIVSDLSEAKELLPQGYEFTGGERVRVNRYAAHALLARAYLYIGEWSNAENEASIVIGNTTLYGLCDNLNDVFLTNSSEAILQLWSDFYPPEWFVFSVLNDPPIFGALREEFVNSFETGDLRRETWVNLSEFGYYETKKYYASQSNPPLQYSTILRLAEQYLIRAEARARTGNVEGSQEDLNRIRTRAHLPETTAATREDLLNQVEQERKAELFTEWSHRWLDLKRTGRVDQVMAEVKPDSWQSTDALYPIPLTQLVNNPAMSNAQNPGY